VTITKTRAVIGTVAYLAPEQFDNAHAVGAAADIFSMGRTLFHLLTGRVPFPYTNLQILPSKFIFIVEKALRENPDDRYSSAAEFARELALLADDGESMEVPAERAKGLLTNLLSGDADAPRGLLEVLITNRDDEVFYREFVPGLPEPALEAMQDASESGFRTLIEAFDQYSEGSHPFSYTDTIADFFRRVFEVATDLRLRQLALSRIFVIGYEHNRFYVRTVFFRVLSHMSGVQETQIAVAVVNENSAAAEWYSQVLSDYSIPRAVRAAFRAA